MGYFSDNIPEIARCAECGEECRVVWTDHGIGSYEYWGQQCVHTDFQAATECCEADWEPIE